MDEAKQQATQQAGYLYSTTVTKVFPASKRQRNQRVFGPWALTSRLPLGWVRAELTLPRLSCLASDQTYSSPALLGSVPYENLLDPASLPEILTKFIQHHL